MGDIFQDDFRDFIKALNDHDVEYVLVGGMAVIIHGYVRGTGDMDVWVNKTKVAWRYLPMPSYFTTAILWSIFFLLNSKFDLIGFIKGLVAIVTIPFNEKRNKVSKLSQEYLNKVEARILF